MTQKNTVSGEEQGQTRTMTALNHNREDHFTCMWLKNTGWKKRRKYNFGLKYYVWKRGGFFLPHIIKKYNGDFPEVMIIKNLWKISISQRRKTDWGLRKKTNKNCYIKNILHLTILFCSIQVLVVCPSCYNRKSSQKGNFKFADN